MNFYEHAQAAMQHPAPAAAVSMSLDKGGDAPHDRTMYRLNIMVGKELHHIHAMSDAPVHLLAQALRSLADRIDK